jgi:hypothetical protein
VKPHTKRESGHPVLDEEAFQQLLSAAYVMQEHNIRLKKTAVAKPSLQVAAVALTPQPIPILATPPAPPIPMLAPPAKAITETTCSECGSTLGSREFFCEDCGAPAARENSPGALQKSWASLWEMHHASESSKTSEEENQHPEEWYPASKSAPVSEDEPEEVDLFPAELQEIVGQFALPEDDEEEPVPHKIASDSVKKGMALVPSAPPTIATADNVPAAPPRPSPWGSAAKARAWLDSLKTQQPSKDWLSEEWRLHRGNIYIALSAAFLLVVVFQWAMQPTPGAAGSQPRELSGYEQILVDLGLAEAPAPEVPQTASPGNPDTKVWVDVHTALYYCPGAELYGKTPNGRVATQLDAQRDNFQPSTRKACD